MTFLEELKQLINRHSIDTKANTPDYVLANAVKNFLEMLGAFCKERDSWRK